MAAIQIQSVSPEYRRPAVLRPLFSFLTKADAMGLLGDAAIRELNPKTLRAVFVALQRAGVLPLPQPLREQFLEGLEASGKEVAQAVAQLLEMVQALEESPAPKQEWPSMRDVFGDELLAKLTGVGASSLLRYANQDRTTPDEVADRLHYLAMVVADLSGSYNAQGIRLWFDRPRAQLGEKSPRQLLGAHWKSGTPSARRVRDLARALSAGGAT